MAKSKNGGVINNLSWKFAERFSAQIVTTVVSIILARLLGPYHYGIISIVSIFITLANVFVSDGLGSALIQKKDADALDFSSVLYFNIFISILLYLLLYVCAPFISLFYGKGYEILTPVLRVMGIRIIIASVNSIQQAYISKKMIFKQFFYSTFIGTVSSAVVGISMAYLGYGVWALVAQYLSNAVFSTLFLAISLKKVPLKAFSIKRVKKTLNYGSKILITSLLITFFYEIRAILIGKKYSPSDLAYYDKGKQFPGLVINNINASISAVLFPKMANEQDNLLKVKETARLSIRFSSYLMCPLMLGFAAVSDSFVKLILTDKWIEVVPYLQIFCISYLFQPIHSANMQAIKAIGRGDIYLKNEIFKKIIELVALIITITISVKAVAISVAVCATISTVINAYPNKKLINYSFIEQFKDISYPIIMAMIMSICVYLIGFIDIPVLLLLIIQVVIGAIIYISLSFFTKNEEFSFILRFIKKYLNRQNTIS